MHKATLLFISSVLVALGSLAHTHAQDSGATLNGASENPSLTIIAPQGPAAVPATPPAPLDPTPLPDSASTSDETAVTPDDKAVLHFELDENTPIAFPTATNRTTTLLFPAPIEDLHGAGITSDPNKAKGDFLAQATPGARYISLTPLREGVRRNFNVIVAGRVYAFEAYAAYPRAAAAYTVIMDDPNNLTAQVRVAVPVAATTNALFPASTHGGQPVTQPARSYSRPKPSYEPAGAARLLGALDSIRLLAGLPDAQQAQQVAGVMPRTTLVARPSTDITDHGDYQVQITHVARFDRFDALGFSVLVSNKTAHRLVFDPESFTARAGDANTGPIYNAVVADMSPEIGPGESRRAFFVLIGDMSGEPNRLDARNPFSISLDVMAPGSNAGRTAASTRRSQSLRKVLRVGDDKAVVNPSARSR